MLIDPTQPQPSTSGISHYGPGIGVKAIRADDTCPFNYSNSSSSSSSSSSGDDSDNENGSLPTKKRKRKMTKTKKMNKKEKNTNKKKKKKKTPAAASKKSTPRTGGGKRGRPIGSKNKLKTRAVSVHNSATGKQMQLQCGFAGPVAGTKKEIKEWQDKYPDYMNTVLTPGCSAPFIANTMV